MKEINIFLEKLMFLAVIGIPVGVFMIFIQSDGRYGFAAMATLVITAVMILSFSILSPLLEIAANTREMAASSRIGKTNNHQNRIETNQKHNTGDYIYERLPPLNPKDDEKIKKVLGISETTKLMERDNQYIARESKLRDAETIQESIEHGQVMRNLKNGFS